MLDDIVKARRKKFYEALESDEYQQGISCLRNNGDEFCCLGVATDVMVKDRPDLGEWRFVGGQPGQARWVFFESGSVIPISELLPVAAQEYYQFESDDPAFEVVTYTGGEEHGCRYATELNDGGMDFKDIAKLFRKRFPCE